MRGVPLGEPFRGTGGPGGYGGLRSALLVDLLRLLAQPFGVAPVLHIGAGHLQGSAAGIDLIVMGEIGKAFEDPKQLLVPRASPDFDIPGAALRTERSEASELIATLRRRQHSEAAECAHEVMGLALAGLARILAEPDTDLLAILHGGIEEQFFDVAR